MSLSARELLEMRGRETAPTRPELTLWLRLFVFQLLIMIVAETVGLAHVLSLIGQPSSAQFATVALPYELGLASLYTILIVAIIVGLVLPLRRSRHAPRYWVATLTAVIPWRILEQTAGRLERSALTRAGIAFRPGGVGLPLLPYLVASATIVGWWLYWNRSASVARIFSARRLDLTSAAP